jgi:hypothetical protein
LIPLAYNLRIIREQGASFLEIAYSVLPFGRCVALLCVLLPPRGFRGQHHDWARPLLECSLRGLALAAIYPFARRVALSSRRPVIGIRDGGERLSCRPAKRVFASSATVT